MNIAIFSGSFNPIHIGHLILGNYVAEFTEIDEVWYLVSPHNPLKDKDLLLPENTRFTMTEEALSSYEYLRASNYEFSLPVPSYTINTLENLKVSYPEHTFYLLIGADNWVTFDKWKDYKKIIENFNILVYPRLGYNIDSDIPLNVKVLASPIIEISSTFIRESIIKGKNVRAFLPEKVFTYISKNNLYK
jgi:nicotinate-nucleotide adenylyltransferase